MMKVLSRIAVSMLFCTVITSGAARAEPTEVTVACYSTTEGGWKWNYCVHKVDPSENTDVVYFFHGVGGNAYDWQNNGNFQQIYDTWGTKAPTVVSVSYGPAWLLAEKNNSRFSGLYGHFVKTALPSIEKNRNLHPTRRLLAGASMGGFNASQLYLKNPELFAKVMLLCPAIAQINPYSEKPAIDDYIKRTNADPTRVEGSLYLSQIYFPTSTAWQNADPLLLAKTRPTAGSPKLLVSTGLQDEYGFFEGSKLFTDAVAAKGASVAYIPVQGGHCSWDWKAAASFLVEP